MRDPRRISRTLGLLEHYWRAHPDLRLAQIIGNARGGGDAYHFEDADLITYLEWKLEEADAGERGA